MDKTSSKVDCIYKLPFAYEDKRLGSSKYYYLTYEDSECREVRTKKELVPNIDEHYIDGQFLKENF